MINKTLFVLLFLSISFGAARIENANAASAKKEFNQAVKILEGRGFSKYAIAATLFLFAQDHDFFDGMNTPYEDKSKHRRYGKLIEHFERANGLGDQIVGRSYLGFIDMEYDPVSGVSLDSDDIINFAREISFCMKRGRPWRDCKLNYHPIDGCFMTLKTKYQCRKNGRWLEWQNAGAIGHRNSGAYCWFYERSPGVVLPFQSGSQVQVDLTRATSVTIDGRSEANKNTVVKKKAIKKKVVKPKAVKQKVAKQKTLTRKTAVKEVAEPNFVEKRVAKMDEMKQRMKKWSFGSKNSLNRPVCVSASAYGSPFDESLN